MRYIRLDAICLAARYTLRGAGIYIISHLHSRYLAFAVKLQRRLEDNYTDFCRPINVKQNTYNQDYGPLSLLLEIGTDGNTLEEARYSAEILAGELADLIKNG